MEAEGGPVHASSYCLRSFCERPRVDSKCAVRTLGRSCSQHGYYIVVHCTTRSTAFMCAFWAVYKCSEALYVDFRSILVDPERRSHRYKRKVDQQSARTWPPYRHDNPARTTLYYL